MILLPIAFISLNDRSFSPGEIFFKYKIGWKPKSVNDIPNQLILGIRREKCKVKHNFLCQARHLSPTSPDSQQTIIHESIPPCYNQCRSSKNIQQGSIANLQLRENFN